MGVARKPGKFRKFSVGRGTGGVCAVAERDSQGQECVSVSREPVSNALSY